MRAISSNPRAIPFALMPLRDEVASVIRAYRSELLQRCDRLREIAAALRRGEINQCHAAHLVEDIADRICRGDE